MKVSVLDYLYESSRVKGSDSVDAKSIRVVKPAPTIVEQVMPSRSNIPAGMLGEHFSDAEFLDSSTARSLGINNTFDSTKHRQNAINLVVKVLDPLRELLGRPIRITSGYRNGELLDAMLKKYGAGQVSKTSDHRFGKSADISVAGMKAEELAAFILKCGLPFDQLIWYSPARGGHVHISYRSPSENRKMVGYAWSKPEKVSAGGSTYADWSRRPNDGRVYA